jgi:predicted DNA binding CopG/RHH family protein
MIKDISLKEIEHIEKEFKHNREDFHSIPADEFLNFKNAIKKSAKQRQISLKITNSDLDSVKARASEKGLKYQSVIKALIHQYATGKITI